jgi:predicted ABC-type ATPase
VRRRFGRSLQNFMALYAPLVSTWALFDNSSAGYAKLVASHASGKLTLKEPTTWLKLKKLAEDL